MVRDSRKEKKLGMRQLWDNLLDVQRDALPGEGFYHLVQGSQRRERIARRRVVVRLRDDTEHRVADKTRTQHAMELHVDVFARIARRRLVPDEIAISGTDHAVTVQIHAGWHQAGRVVRIGLS